MQLVIILILDAGADKTRHGVAILDAEFAADRSPDWQAAYAGLPVQRGGALTVQGPFPVLCAAAATPTPDAATYLM